MSQRHRRRGTLTAVAVILLAALAGIVAPSLTACDGKTSTAATTAAPTTTPVIPTTTPATETAKPAAYPFQSLVARTGKLPAGITTDGFYLVVYVDLGKQLTAAEADALMSKATLTDMSGNTYQPVSLATEEGISLASYNNEGKLLMEWSAEYAYCFGFVVGSKMMDYAFVWTGCEPIDIGNPYEAPFLYESE